MGMEEVEKSVKDDETEYSNKPWDIIVYFALVAVTLIGALELYNFFNFFPGSEHSHEAWGTTGDFFGGTLNPLLQFVVIAMLFLSIHIQKNELKISNATLRATQADLAETQKTSVKQAEELEKQTEILKQQQQDNLEQIKVAQEISILDKQKEVLEKLLYKPISHWREEKTTINMVINDPTLIKDDFFLGSEETSYQRKISANISVVLHRLSMSLCALLECKNIPVTTATIETEWLIGNLYKLNKTNVVGNKVLVEIKNDLYNKVHGSTLDIKNKELLEDIMSVLT